MTIHIHPRKLGPLSSDERKQLSIFFEAVMDLRTKEDVKKGKIHDKHKRN